MQQTWQSEAEEADDLNRFTRWLVTNGYLTEYQVAMLLRGHADSLFLDQYKLLERIGKGRMAGVYKAVSRSGQMVAIKILPPSKARDPRLLARFEREASLACRLSHPHVVRAFESGRANGIHYLVMEYLAGETLQEVLERRGSLTPTEASHVIHQALLGLQHLFEQGLVHRNLEPANLMLVSSSGELQPPSVLATTVKILDISLSHSLLDDSAPGTNNPLRLTHEGEFLGIPNYLAPEQARDAHTADIRADIYSLGCILYQALTGIPPFRDSTALDQIIRHATETPMPLAALNPQVPGALQLIVNWMMARYPGQRYPTPERAAEALHLFLLHEGISASGPISPEALSGAAVLAPRPCIQSVPDMAGTPSVLDREVLNTPGEGPHGKLTASLSADLPREEPGAMPPVDLIPTNTAGAEEGLNFDRLLTAGRRAVLSRKPAGLERRDYLLLMIGALGLFLAQLIGWILAHLVLG